MKENRTMDERLFKTLLASGENTDLDYKREHVGPQKTVRAIMAIANELPTGKKGYILFGVEETESGVARPVGVPGELLDDADVHDWVDDCLNDVPTFRYYGFEHQKHRCAVIEIVGDGRRPFFPIKDVPWKATERGGVPSGEKLALRCNVALHRRGSKTTAAPPPRIIDWWREDHSDDLRLKSLELAEAEQRVVPRLEISMVQGTDQRPNPRAGRAQSRMGSRPLAASATVRLRNIGMCSLSVLDSHCEWMRCDTGDSVAIELAASTVGLLRNELLPGEDRRFGVHLFNDDCRRLGAHDVARFPMKEVRVRMRCKATSALGRDGVFEAEFPLLTE